jgi:hypothetical protein
MERSFGEKRKKIAGVRRGLFPLTPRKTVPVLQAHVKIVAGKCYVMSKYNIVNSEILVVS